MKRQLHSSHIGMFLRCAYQWFLRYVREMIRPPRVALVAGSATHKAIEKNMLNKLHKGELLSLGELRELASMALHEEWGKLGVELSDEEKGKGEEVVRGEAEDMTVALSSLHATALAPHIEPTHVERPWVVDIEGYDYSLGGRLDLQAKSDNPYGVLRDTKTAAKTPSAGDADKKLQLTVYATAVNVIDGGYPDIAVDYLIKTKTPKAVTQDTTRDKEDTLKLLEIVQSVGESIDKGVFPPANREIAWWCSPQWCGYADGTCKYYRRGK